MSDEKMREEFEAWASTHYVLMELSTDFEDGEYVEPDMQYASEAWQASRVAVVIELPRALPTDRGYVVDRDEVVEAIEAAGIKVQS